MWVILFIFLFALALLMRWTDGGEIARVLVFLLLAVLSFALFPPDSAAGVFAIVGTVLGWYVSGIPTYMRRRRLRLGQA